MNVRYRLAKRGAIYHVYNVKFPEITKHKYCLLMEDIYNNAKTLIVVLTTKNMDYEYKNTAIRANVKGMGGSTLIELDNYHEFPVDVFLNESKSEYIGLLSNNKIQEVNEKLKCLKIKHEIWIRMQPNVEPY